MNKFYAVAVVAISTGSGLVATAASAMPAWDLGTRLPPQPIEQVRIICEPFGPCFRIDHYGRRILVRRPEGFGRPGFGEPGFGRPPFGGPEFDGPGVGRPGFGRPGFPDEPGFRRRDGDRGPRDRLDNGQGDRRDRRDPNGFEGDRRDPQGAGQRRPPQGDNGQIQQGGGPQDGMRRQQRPGGDPDDQGGGQRRRRPADQRNPGIEMPNDGQ